MVTVLPYCCYEGSILRALTSYKINLSRQQGQEESVHRRWVNRGRILPVFPMASQQDAQAFRF